MAKPFKKIFILVLALLALAATHTMWMPAPAKFLAVKDNIQRADAIVVLSGDWKFDRENKALELYRSGVSKKIIRMLERDNVGFNMMRRLLNSTVSEREAYQRYFENGGAARDAIILGDNSATTTFTELKGVKDMASRYDFKSLILVTSDYHMRRALMTANWLFKGQGVKLYTATARSGDFMPDRWWLDNNNVRGVVIEYLGVVFYIWYHFALGK